MKIQAKQRLQASDIAPEARSLIERAVHALKPVQMVDGKKAMNIRKVSTALEKAGFKVKLVDDLYRQEAPAYVLATEQHTLYINRTCGYWAVPEYVMKKAHAAGQIGTNDPLHVIYHECAHMAHLLKDVRWQGDEEQIASKVSRYATQNRNEFIAEYTAGVMAGKNYPEDVDNLYNNLMAL